MSLLLRLQQVFGLMTQVATVFRHGFLHACQKQRLNGLTSDWLNPRVWWSYMLAKGFPIILDQVDEAWSAEKADLVGRAYGRVLEIGPGAGHTLAYYNKEHIEKIYGVEPRPSMPEELRSAVIRHKLEDVFQLVDASLCDDIALEAAGIAKGSFDTVVCVQVLCSASKPKDLMRSLQTFLKPGGQLLLFEHDASEDAWTAKVQHLINPVYSSLFGNCNTNRPSAQWLSEIGGWSSAKLWSPTSEGPESLSPHAIGVYVRA